jgi:hypothetical protein
MIASICPYNRTKISIIYLRNLFKSITLQDLEIWIIEHIYTVVCL